MTTLSSLHYMKCSEIFHKKFCEIYVFDVIIQLSTLKCLTAVHFKEHENHVSFLDSDGQIVKLHCQVKVVGCFIPCFIHCMNLTKTGT